MLDLIADALQPLPALLLLRNAILRLDPRSSTLTSTHHLLLQVCLQCRAFRYALPVLDRSIYHVASSIEKRGAANSNQYLCSKAGPSLAYLNPDVGLSHESFGSRAFLEYHLYGAMVYMGLKQWAKALSFLEIVLVAPTSNTTSVVMVEAYKKYILVRLLMDGQAPTPPKGINQNVLRDMRALSISYDCFADAFMSGSLMRLKRVIEDGHPFWLSDCNFGLVFQAFDAFRKFSVLRLARVYAALPLMEVARRTSPDPTNLVETAAYISALIASGDLKATLSRSPDMAIPATLRFLSASSTPWTEGSLHRDLHDHQAELDELLHHLQDSDDGLETSREFIEKLRSLKVQKEQEAKASGGVGGITGGGGGRPLDDFDEDVMGGL